MPCRVQSCTVPCTFTHSPGLVRFTASSPPEDEEEIEELEEEEVEEEEEEEEEKEGTWLCMQFAASQAKSVYPRAGSGRLTATDRR